MLVFRSGNNLLQIYPGLKEQIKETELKEHIEAAKSGNEKEKSLSFQIAPLNPDLRLIPVDCQVNKHLLPDINSMIVYRQFGINLLQYR